MAYKIRMVTDGPHPNVKTGKVKDGRGVTKLGGGTIQFTVREENASGRLEVKTKTLRMGDELEGGEVAEQLLEELPEHFEVVGDTKLEAARKKKADEVVKERTRIRKLYADEAKKRAAR